MPPKTERSETKKKASSSTCPASRSGSSSSTAARAEDVMYQAAGRQGDRRDAASSASSPGKGGINGAEPAKKRRNRRKGRNKPGSSSTGTQANENSAAAAAGGTPSSSASPPPPPPRVPSPPFPSPGCSSGSRGNPVEVNSAAGQRPHPAAAAAGSSSSSAAAINNGGDPSAARSSPRKKTGGNGGVTSPASSPVRDMKDPSAVLTRSPKKPAVGGGTVVQLTSTTTSRIEVVEHLHYALTTLKQSTCVHGSGRQQIKAADAASASSGTGTLPDHAVSKIGGAEDMVRNELLKHVPLSVDFEPQLQFLKFLYEYTIIPGEQYPFYKAQVLSLSKRKCYILEVNFDHLKRSFFKNTTQYSDLVFKIVNNPDRTQSWLRKVVFVFLKSEGFDADEKTIYINAKVDFTNKPHSIIMLSDALIDRTTVVRKLGVVHDEVIMNASTAYGTSTFLVVLAELLNKHRKEKSYNGKFEIGNIVIVNSKLCWILMEPSPVKSAREMKSDLGKLWTIMEQYYSNEGHLPLYFAELQDDLVNEKLSNVTMEWFRLHLEYHPAFMPSMERRNMIYGLKSVIQDNKSLMGETFTSFLDKEPFESKDWRDKIKKGHSKIMEGVYKFGPIGLKRDPLAETGFSQDYFANTWEGLLWYIRNFLVHANKTAKIVDTDEIELFAASKFPMFLPRLLKTVLSNCKIEPYFRGVFSSYRTSRSNLKDLPS